MAVVTFNYCAFIARFPEFSSVSQDNVTACFSEAGIFCNNTDSSLVQDITVRALLLNYLTAHLVALYFGTNGQAASQLVGRVTSAGEGSVNVSVDMGSQPTNSSWYNQTKYGASYWRLAAPYRSMLYVPGPRPIATYVPRG